MKRCPQCNRSYTDDALSFCLDDGSPLVTESAPSSFDPGATIQYPQSRDTAPQPTIAYGPGQTPPPSMPPQAAAPPAWSPMPPMQAQKRSVWPWILGIGGILIFMGIGALILIVWLASMSGDNNNNANSNSNSNSRVANRNSNANANANDNTNAANANTRSTLASFTDDFSTESWGTGPSQYGKIWYEDEEYHMHATKGGYIVMYSPDKPEYHDENATVRITMRSVDGDPPNAGYGLLVHGEKKDGVLEDYGFLLFNGTDPKYKIVEHKGGNETKLADWTSSSSIRTGTTPNQIEVRIRDKRMDFYVNGQFVTSVTDNEGYLRGRVGLYSSDTGEVAFDDLEISK